MSLSSSELNNLIVMIKANERNAKHYILLCNTLIFIVFIKCECAVCFAKMWAVSYSFVD